jgi:hypothetical protein
MPRAPARPPRPSKITIPERCDPRAKIVFALMREQGVTYDELEYRSGVLRSTFKAWRTNNKPGLDTLEAALGALGWSLLAVPNDASRLPDTVREGLKALSAQWEGEDALLTGLLATVSRTAVAASAAAPLVMPTPPWRKRGRPVHPDQVPLFESEVA